MNDPELSAALQEAENEDWEKTRASIRKNLERILSDPVIGSQLVDGFRVFHRQGWLAGYKRALADRST